MSDSGGFKTSSFIKYRDTKPLTSKTSTETSPLNISGCKTSVQNNQLLTSIGIPSIDYFIGGGLPVGSVCIIGEDTMAYYSDIVCRCFIAEGVLNKHEIFIADPLINVNNVLERLPNTSSSEMSNEKSSENTDTKLRIAWRYSEQANKATINDQQHSNYFYLNKHMTKADMADCLIGKFDFDCERCCDGNLYRTLSEDLNNLIEQKYSIKKLKQFKSILRIMINSVGSAFWNDNCYEHGTSTKLFRFLYGLRQTLRHSLSVCLITVNNDLIKDEQFLAKISNLSDYVFVMDTLDNTKNRLEKTQYDGLFHIVKLARLNTLNSYLPETLDLAFNVKRKRFVVEILALPPDITEDGDEKKGRTNPTSSMSCSSGAGGKLEF